MNSFLSIRWPLQKSAIFAKIGPKTARFWVFDEMAITFEWKSMIVRQMVHYWTLSWKKSGLCKNQPFLQKSAQKQPDFDFFILGWRFYLQNSMFSIKKLLKFLFKISFFEISQSQKLTNFTKFRGQKFPKIRPGPKSFSFEPGSKPVGLPPPTNRCLTSIWGF